MIMQLRNVNYEFIEAEVQNLKNNGEVSPEAVRYRAEDVEGADEDVFVARDSYDGVLSHADDARVQVETIEEPKDECPDCGESFKDVGLHIAKSDCEEVTDDE